MDQAISGLLGAFIGASSALLGGVSIEAFRRRRDRQSVAIAMAGAVEAELHAVRSRGHVAMFEGLLTRLRAGEKMKFYGFTREEDTRNHVVDAYLDKIGLLTGELPGDVILFFQTMWGVRVDTSRLVSGAFGDEPSTLVGIIEQDLKIMANMNRFGPDLVRRLKRSAGD